MKYHILIIALLVAMNGMSQSKDAKAKALLEEVSFRAKAAKSIKADFTYTMENQKAKINEEKSGSVFISGNKYRMTASGQSVYCDGKTIWTYISESNEVQINDASGNEDAITPTSLLSTYNANYQYKMIKSEDETLDMVELIPNKIKNVTRVIISVNKLKKQITGFKIFDKSGNTFTYKIKNYVTDSPVTANDFVFDEKKFPGVEKIDMR